MQELYISFTPFTHTPCPLCNGHTFCCFLHIINTKKTLLLILPYIITVHWYLPTCLPFGPFSFICTVLWFYLVLFFFSLKNSLQHVLYFKYGGGIFFKLCFYCMKICLFHLHLWSAFSLAIEFCVDNFL